MQAIPFTTPVVSAKKKETMKAVEWHGAQDVRVVERPQPAITDSKDAILRVTCATICGSDLHFYLNMIPGAMEKGDVLGHEFMGIIDDVGSEVTKFKKGDRVVASAVIADGTCWYCQRGLYSVCDTTNPSKEMEEMYGHRTAGVFGYSHLTGGWDGGQAEYVRVPIADVNLLHVPETLSDEQALFLSDIVCTGWQANEMAHVSEGQTVAVWGCGPVGLMAQKWAKYRGASRVIGIDNVPYRLQIAREIGSETINFDEIDPLEALKHMLPRGPDVAIDAAGFRFPKTLTHKAMMALKLESDSLDILTETIKAVRKAGTVSVVGDYFRTGDGFPAGAFMEKALCMVAGQVHVQQYWHHLCEKIEKGEFDPTFVITHHMTLDQAPEAYKMFANRENNCLKVILHMGDKRSK